MCDDGDLFPADTEDMKRGSGLGGHGRICIQRESERMGHGEHLTIKACGASSGGMLLERSLLVAVFAQPPASAPTIGAHHLCDVRSARRRHDRHGDIRTLET
jgi:hypothetical protein